MNIARLIGIGIVMIVPTFVIGGGIWDISHSWVAVIIWVIIMAIFTGRLIKSKIPQPAD